MKFKFYLPERIYIFIYRKVICEVRGSDLAFLSGVSCADLGFFMSLSGKSSLTLTRGSSPASLQGRVEDSSLSVAVMWFARSAKHFNGLIRLPKPSRARARHESVSVRGSKKY